MKRGRSVSITYESGTLRVLIRNNGYVNVTSKVVVYLDENSACSGTLSLGPDDKKEITCSLNPEVGSHKIKVVIDPDGQVDESNEENDVGTKLIKVKKKIIIYLDLTVGSLNRSWVIVANRGNESASFELAIYLDGEELDKERISLSPNS